MPTVAWTSCSPWAYRAAPRRWFENSAYQLVGSSCSSRTPRLINYLCWSCGPPSPTSRTVSSESLQPRASRRPSASIKPSYRSRPLVWAAARTNCFLSATWTAGLNLRQLLANAGRQVLRRQFIGGGRVGLRKLGYRKTRFWLGRVLINRRCPLGPTSGAKADIS